jgi:hypothetical protein
MPLVAHSNALCGFSCFATSDPLAPTQHGSVLGCGIVLLLLSVVLAYMDVVVVLCLASVGCVSEPYALQTVGELLWWYVSVKHGLD